MLVKSNNMEGLHGTEVAFAPLTQQPWVWLLSFEKIISMLRWFVG